MKAWLKRIVVRSLNWRYPNLTKGASILMYHAVTNDQAFSTVTPTALESHLQYLKENRMVVPLSQIVRRLKRSESVAGLVALTFDDGRCDFYETVFPLLKKFNLPASVFVVTGAIGSSYQGSSGQSVSVVGADDIKEMVASGLVECHPHSMSHPKLTQLTLTAATEEIDRSTAAMIDLVGSDQLMVFAFPSGCYNEDLLNYIDQHPTLTAAVTVIYGLADKRSRLAELPRNLVDSTTDLAQLQLKVSDGIVTYAAAQRLI